jgi:hydroxymethylbilane synthase
LTLRIATRQSPLALWQAEHVKALLQSAHPGLPVTLVPMTTSGDQRLEGPLATAGGKGLFVKELEDALLGARADIAVHSMKDVPARQPAGLALAAFLAAADPRDAFVSARFAALRDLPQGAHVGTSSLRRQAQLRAERPDVRVSDLRGNVGTRLKRLDEGRYDAVLLACAGLARLGLAERITEALAVERFVPAIGQGIIGVECREGDAATRARLAPLNDAASATRLAAERAMNARLGGACTVPVAGHAIVRAGHFTLTGLVAAPDGSRIVKARIEGASAKAAELGDELAGRLLAAGGAEILRSIGVELPDA